MSKTAGSSRNYSNQSKEHWRGWAWNQVLERTAGKERRSPILYLLGPEDNDRRVAIRKGVPPHNLIGIDRSIDNVKRSRSNGGLAIQGSLDDVLASWPRDVEVAAVIADFCCGIEKNNCNLLSYFVRESLRSSVLLVNLMRGRDGWSNELRSEVSEGFRVMFPRGVGLEHSEKNRAVTFSLYQAWGMISQVAENSEFPFTVEEFQSAIRATVQAMSPSSFSYKSGHVVFDSVCLTPPDWKIRRSVPVPGGVVVITTTVKDPTESGPSLVEYEEGSRTAPPEEIARRIAATLAHRTMKSKGTKLGRRRGT